MPELAAAVLALADDIAPEQRFSYAGDSVGGAVGLQLLLDAPERVTSAALLCTGAVIGDPELWRVRAATVRESGTESVVLLSAERWFAAGFADREPAVAAALLDALRDTNAECYALVCEALAVFDVVDRLPQITTPVLAIAGAQDIPTPPEGLAQIASGVSDGRLIVLDGVGHLAPAEAPDRVADLIAGQLARNQSDHLYEAGMAVRREVLGDSHVDRALAATNEFTADFQELITRYAWGSIWTRPGLDRRSRSLITLTALVARGHHEELAMHVRAARRNGVTTDEIKELLLQTAIYCGVPDANSAFRIANKVLMEYDPAEENR
jgi:3-oxoadipate enol-lactonase/4-carboxymuconolactone decarboxylase